MSYKEAQRYQVSDEFKNNCKSNVGINRTGRIHIVEDDIDITDEDNLVSFTVEDNCYVNDKFIGTTVAKKVTVNIINPENSIDLENKEIEVYAGVEHRKEVTETGTNVILESDLEIPIDITVKGNSIQETRSGKNLLPNTATNGTTNGVSFTKNEDGSISIKGTSTARTLYNINLTKPITLLENTNYVISKVGNDDVVEIYLRKSSVSELIASTAGTSTYKKFTNTYTEEIFCYVAIPANVTIDTTISIQLEEGTTPTEYEQYGASPSPEYPSEIKSVGDDVNLFSGLVKGKGINGTTGAEITSSSSSASGFIPVNFNQNPSYYLSGLTNQLTSFVSAYNSNKEFLGRSAWNAKTNIDINKTIFTYGTAQGTGDIAYLRVIQSEGENTTGNIDDIDNLKIKLQKGTKATAYSEYGKGTVGIKQTGGNQLKGFAEGETSYFYSLTQSQLADDFYFKATPLANNWLKVECDRTGETTTDVKYINAFVGINRLPNIKTSTDYTIIVEFRNVNITKISGGLSLARSSTNETASNAIFSLSSYIDYSKIKNGAILKFLNPTESIFKNQTVALRNFHATYTGDKFSYEMRVSVVEGDYTNKDYIYDDYKENNYVLQISEPLRSLPNGVRDTIEEDGIHRRVRHTTFSKVSVLYDFKNGLKYGVNSKTPIGVNTLSQNINVLCDKAQCNESRLENTIYITGNGKNIVIFGSADDTIETFNSKFAGAEFIYELAEEIIEPYTDNPLLKATSYKNITNIFSTDEVSPIIEVKYGKEKIPFGNFIIEKTDNKEVKEKTSFIGYDYMKKFNKTYEDIVQYPITLGEYLKKLCNFVGVSLGTDITTLVNANYEIKGNPFTNKEDCKTVLGNIAQLCGGFAKIGRDNKLYIVTLGNQVLDNIDGNNYFENFAKNKEWGEVNSLIVRLSDIEGENTTIQDSDSININGLTELTIAGNYFLINQTEREEVINELWTKLKGMKYLPFTTEYYGFPYLDSGDCIEIADNKDVYFKSYVFNHSFTYNGTFKGKIETKALTKTQTALKNTNDIKTKFRNIEYKVDKINGEITSIAEQQTDTETRLTQTIQNVESLTDTVARKDDVTEQINELKQTIDGTTSKIINSGGSNLLYYTEEFWEALDENSLINIEEYSDTDIQRNTLSQLGYRVNNGGAVQKQTVKNGLYTISFLYKKMINLATGYVLINGVRYDLDTKQNNKWEEKVITVDITTNTIDFEIISDTNNSFIIADLMMNAGTEKQVWSQNANETLTDTVKIGKGIQVESSSSNTYTRIDSDGNRTFNRSTNERVAEMTDKGVYANELEVKGQAKINILLIQEIDNQVWITGIGG